MAADEGLNSASITKAYSYVVRQREGLNSGSINRLCSCSSFDVDDGML